MKHSVLHALLLSGLLLLILAHPSALAQKQPRQPYATNIRISVDTVSKRVRFTYDLPRLFAPDDSLYIQLKSVRDRTQTITPISVSGNIGTNLAPGNGRVIEWDPLADGKTIDEDVTVAFYVLTSAIDSTRRGFLSLTKRQVINLGRWGVSAGLLGVTIARGIQLNNAIGTYNNAEAPINVFEKAQSDRRQTELIEQRRQLTPWVTASAVSLLANGVYSLVRKKPTHSRLSWQGSGTSMRVAYTF